MTAHSATAFVVPLELYPELNFLPPISIKTQLSKELDAKLEELGRRFAQQQ